jgi:hypothetical protein
MPNRLMLSVVLVLLYPLVAFAAGSAKSDDHEGKRATATKREAGPPPKPDHHPAPSAPAPASRPPRPAGGGSGHAGPDAGVIHRPGSLPPPSHRPDVSPQPYNRNDWQSNHFSYPDPGRAYSQPPLPPRPQPRWDARPFRDDHRWSHDDHFWSGGWIWGPSWEFDFGYSRPYPRDVLVPVPYPVPGPTEYYPVPSTDYAPQYVPAPVPADGTPAAAPEDLPLLGCDIVAADGAFLGVIDREYDSPQSVANRNSAFGNPASPTSIWNPKSEYGSPTGQYSPWNPQAQTPPMLSWHGAFKSYLTTNPDIKPAIDPGTLSEAIQATPWR